MASLKQRVLRFFYPLVKKMGRSGENGTILSNTQNAVPPKSFYELQADLNNGQKLDLSSYSGKKVLLVNTASNCGYTGQYAELQSLHEQMGDKLALIAFPSNDFFEEEKGNDHDIAAFCQLNYGVSFPLAKKGVVLKKAEQQNIFQWLTNPASNGWCEHEPDWNFGKYLIDEKGNLTHYFGPSISPLEKPFLEALKK